jgi:hypothetical protein
MTLSLKYLIQDIQMKELHTARFIISITVPRQDSEVLTGSYLWIIIILTLPLSLYSTAKITIFYCFLFRRI